MTNCPNCGAPITDYKCQYCGAVIFDFASIEVGKPAWINFKLGERWVLAHVLPESASMHVEPMDEVDYPGIKEKLHKTVDEYKKKYDEEVLRRLKA